MKVKTLKTQRKIFADKSKELTKTEYERLLTAAKGQEKRKAVLFDTDDCKHRTSGIGN
jgi:hypothetical protein